MLQKVKTIIPVILCGGVGSRLWPVSRQNHPKQFSNILGGSTSLFQQAVKRIDNSLFGEPLIVTSSSLRFFAEKQLRDLSINAKILLEPSSKNTAPAVLASTYVITEKLKNKKGNMIDPKDLILVMPADHYIPDTKAFKSAIQRGVSEAIDGKIVTFGIKPNKLKTGYGYLELEDTITPISQILNFHEKPSIEKIRSMMAAGNFCWNAGIFLFRADIMLELATAHQPTMLAQVKSAFRNGKMDNNFFHFSAAEWSNINSISIDYAIMEKIKNISCVKYSGPWFDAGDWQEVGDILGRDDNGNTISGESSAIDCTDSILWSDANNTHLFGIGLNKLIAVATDDAVLVASADRVQDIRKVVNVLETRGINQANLHSKDYRPWGWFENLVDLPQYKVKRLHINPNSSLSLQSHKKRSEHWIVVEGVATIIRGNDEFTLNVNESTFIDFEEKHRLSNPNNSPLIVIEVQTGSYLGEDDIIRYQDDYNRTN